MKHVLTATDAPDPLQMGGKAAALARLGEEFPVPPWFVLSPSSFADGKIKPEAKMEMRAALSRLGSGPFAVRSSAADEDGKENSFAGQMESHLNVAGEQVEVYALKVFRSAFTEEVRLYREKRGLGAAEATPGVLIQNMVNASAAGVAFSEDPVHPGQARMLVMATNGLADELVSGRINGDTYAVTRQGELISQTLAGQEAVLDKQQLKAIASLCLKAEKHFSCPQDIEWAMEGDNLFIVQARPITATAASPEGELKIWDNSNIVESYSGVTSPLTFSFASYTYAEVYRAFAQIMGVSRARIESNRHVFSNMLGFINGHVYYNLLNWYRVLSLMAGYKTNRQFMEQMMGVSEALPQDIAEEIAAEGAGFAAKAGDFLNFVSTACKLLVNSLTLDTKVKKFYARLDRVLAETEKPLSDMCEAELVGHYRYLERELLAQWQTPIINDFLCMIACGLSQKMLAKWCGEIRGRALHNDCMIGQGDIISAEPAKRIREMARMARDDKETVAFLTDGNKKALERNETLRKAFGDYLRKFGDRCIQELKLESKTLHDDPSTLLRAIGHTATANREAPKRPETSLANTLEEAMAGHPVKKWALLKLVKWAKARVRDRENLRFERTRVFGRVRNIFLRLGERFAAKKMIADSRDIFFLEVGEALGAVDGTITHYDLGEIAAARKMQAEEFKKTPAMPNRFETRGAMLLNLRGRMPLSAAASQAGGDSRTGMGCCAGLLTAKVRVVLDPSSESLLPGEILVAKHTDPGWIALFSNASGILVERGSLLSHSAIVAREMGIPAIVAISDVTSWLKTGDLVEMDGSSGIVQKKDGGEQRD